MFCRQCGNELPDGAAFCGKCGAPQSDAQAPEQKNSVNDRYETKVIQVHPDDETAAIEKYELFGWDCAHSQTVKTKDSHLEQGFGDSIVSVTETETFVKLTFKRRLNMPNYDRLKELEEEYDAANALEGPPKPRKWPIIVGWICILWGAGSIALESLKGIILIPVGIALFVYSLTCKKRLREQEAEWQEEYEKAQMIKYSCIEEARTLL